MPNVQFGSIFYMKKTFLTILLLTTYLTPAYGQATCPRLADLPLPIYIGTEKLHLVCKDNYASAVDIVGKIPSWTAYVSRHEHLPGCVKRANLFREDSAVPFSARARNADYVHSHYDRGHMVPAEDMSFSMSSMVDSFSMVNISPQVHTVNAGVWEEIEKFVRNYTFQNKTTILVYSGTIYDTSKGPIKIGQGVVVPTAFYKVLVDKARERVLSFIVPNDALLVTRNIAQYIVPLSDVEAATYLRFSIDKATYHIDEELWEVPQSNAVSSAKKNKCSLI